MFSTKDWKLLSLMLAGVCGYAVVAHYTGFAPRGDEAINQFIAGTAFGAVMYCLLGSVDK